MHSSECSKPFCIFHDNMKCIFYHQDFFTKLNAVYVIRVCMGMYSRTELQSCALAICVLIYMDF